MTSRIEDNLTLSGNLRVVGNIELTGTFTGLARTDLTQENLTAFDLPPETWRVWDNMDALLPDPPAGSDDLGIANGTFGTGTPSIQTNDLKNAGATTQYARRLRQLPYNYVAGETVIIRLRAGMKTTVASSSATVDVECYKTDNFGGVSGTDLCATAATTCNSLTDADKDFTITATALSPGDWLDIRIAIAVNDSATVTAVKGCIGRVQLLCDTKG